ncbi:hypothetical protein HY995_01880 [Candidatus Micrarchaeota archaeon]|nr:hypothetical protein [Candidatus Micrarchaeota archaeon]
MASLLSYAALACGILLVLKDFIWLTDAKRARAYAAKTVKRKQGYFNAMGVAMFLAGLALLWVVLQTASLLEMVVMFFASSFVICSFVSTIPGMPAAAWKAVGRHKDEWFKLKAFIAVSLGLLIMLFVLARAF